MSCRDKRLRGVGPDWLDVLLYQPVVSRLDNLLRHVNVIAKGAYALPRLACLGPSAGRLAVGKNSEATGSPPPFQKGRTFGPLS